MNALSCIRVACRWQAQGMAFVVAFAMCATGAQEPTSSRPAPSSAAPSSPAQSAPQDAQPIQQAPPSTQSPTTQPTEPTATPEPAAVSASELPYTETLRGQVVFLADVLKRRFGVQSDDDTAALIPALETEDGRLIPLVKDVRGRGFLKDERLRNIPLELVLRRFPGTTVSQVMSVRSVKDGQVFALDYWCDICAISMFELKACECCQGPIRIREQLLPAEEK